MTGEHQRLPRDKQQDVQLALEALNDWHASSGLIDRRRPWFFSALIASWFCTIATGFEPSREYLIWLIGRLGIVAVWFGSISFFLIYVNSFRAARALEKQIQATKEELAALGLAYHESDRSRPAWLEYVRTGEPFDPYDNSYFAD